MVNIYIGNYIKIGWKYIENSVFENTCMLDKTYLDAKENNYTQDERE